MTEPTRWILKPKQKKSVEEHVVYSRGDQQLIRIEGYRDAWAVVTSADDRPPEFDFNNLHGIDISAHESYDSIQFIDNGWYVDFVYPDDMSQQEQNDVVDAWDGNYDHGLELLGWEPVATQYWLFGELELVHDSWVRSQDYAQA